MVIEYLKIYLWYIIFKFIFVNYFDSAQNY
jgi:hypothetical protein